MDHAAHGAALGILGDSAFLILGVFFVVGGFIVFRMLGAPPKPIEPPPEAEAPPDRDREC
jgi:hypothetical protein